MIPLPKEVVVVEKGKNRAKIEISPLYPGYGVTIGNSLRRVLLSSLEGTAVSKMKITGVPHEFSAIPGVLEDVITIMLNLKELRFKMIGEGPQKAKLSVKGEKEVKGKDFQLPSQVEVVNGNYHIATLTDKKAKLEMEIEIEKGIGYLTREDRARNNEKEEIGVILLDSLFSPIKNVAFKVENTRVGKRTDFDKLVLEIETDGTISPEEAFQKASEILKEHFNLLSLSFKEGKGKEKVEEEKNEKEEKGKKTKSGKGPKKSAS